MVNVEDLSAYLKRNEKIQGTKIKKLMEKLNLGYRDVVRDLIEKHVIEDREVDKIMHDIRKQFEKHEHLYQ